MDSAITPVTVRLSPTALDRAQSEGAQALIVQLNTPGGLERSMRSMVQTILGSPIPVIVYVAPTGARAASAGVFITMAAHVAAMAPATNIGAAHSGGGGRDHGQGMTKKVENDAPPCPHHRDRARVATRSGPRRRCAPRSRPPSGRR